MKTIFSKNRGFSLIEVMVSMALFSLVTGAMAPSFIRHLHANNTTEVRTEAIAAVIQQIDSLRVGDPFALPASTTILSVISINGRSFDLSTNYRPCVIITGCSSPNSRQIKVTASYKGKAYYDAETVFTRLR